MQELVPALKRWKGALVGWQAGGSSFGQARQRQLRRGNELGQRDGDRDRRGPALGLGGLARFERDDVSGAGPGREGGLDAGDDVAVLQVPVQQQDVDQGLRTIGLAERVLGRGPEGLVSGSKGACAAGLIECLGAGQGSRLGQQTSRKWSSTTRSAPFVVRREWRAISVRPWKTTTSFERSRTWTVRPM